MQLYINIFTIDNLLNQMKQRTKQTNRTLVIGS